MSQQTYLRHSKVPSSTSTPTKAIVLEWISTILPDYSMTAIEQLGDGQAYCRIINHYSPTCILPSRIIYSPKNDYEYSLNLKQFQTALCKLRLNIPFDIHRVSKRKFNENWALICQLYKAMEQQECKKTEEPKKEQPQSPANTQPPKNLSEQAQKMSQFVPRNQLRQEYPEGSLLFTIDRVKEVMLANTHDTEKIRLIKMLFGMEREVKVEETDLMYNVSE